MKFGAGTTLGFAGGGATAPDVTAPTLVSVATNTAGTTITLTYNEALDAASEPATSAYLITSKYTRSGYQATDALVTVSSLDVTGSTVVLTLSSAIYETDNIRLSYTPPGSGNVQDVAGNDAAALSYQAVTNSSTAALNLAAVTGAVWWHDLLDAGSYTQAGTVTSITNKVSSVAWTEATNPPAYSATGFLGQPSMVGDNANDIIASTEAAVFGAVAGAVAGATLYLLAKPGSDDADDCFFGAGNSGISSNRTRLWGKSVSGVGSYNVYAVDNSGGSSSSNFLAFSGSTDTSEHVYSWREGSSTAKFRIDGHVIADWEAITWVPGTQTLNRCAWNMRPDSGPDTPGGSTYAEGFLITRKVGDSEDARYVNFFHDKWTFPAFTPTVRMMGDSISRGDFGASTTVAAALSGVTATKTNHAVNGATMADIADGVSGQKSAVQVLFEGGNAKQILVCGAGSNDFFTAASTAAETFADHVTMATFARSIGHKYIAINTRYRNPADGTNAAANTAANVRADALKVLMDAEMAGSNGVPRFDGYYDMLQAYKTAYGSDGWDAGAFVDDTHDNNTGQALLVAGLTTVINAVLAA